MPKNQKKKAFTLTELLVVVVIIGVLAAVVLPKFNKVVETRKTTEAEEIMAAVRTEQEYRCAMDKPYIGDISKLSEIIPQVQTKNFTYQLETNGMLASSRGKYTYDLKMPSYADGRVCCDGAECTKLNKDYPLCDDLIARADYKASTECAAEIPVVAPCVDNSGHHAGETQDTTNAAGCTVRKTWVSFNSAPGVCAWETTENIISCPACDDNDPLAIKKDVRKCKPADYPTLECGEQTKGYYCNASTNYQYVAEPDDAWSTCEPTDECHQEADCCDEGFTGNFAECIGQKYGYESAEYKCARPGSGYGECKFSLGLGSGTGDIDSLSASEEYKDWLRGGYRRWACDRKIPCAGEPPSAERSCNRCGTRTAVYECNQDVGRWEWISFSECSMQPEECGENICSEFGTTRTETFERTCSYEHITTVCTNIHDYGVWKFQSREVELKSGAECVPGPNSFKTVDGNRYICDATCQWILYPARGGGSGGGGGTSSCSRFTDLYSGSFCNVCSGDGYNVVNCY